jgi:soluble lytic murein transglycosylase-like protein
MLRASLVIFVSVVANMPRIVGAEGDISDALRFASPIMGDEVAEGYEDLVGEDPDEALSLLLSQNVVPGQSPDAYLEDDGLGIKVIRHELRSLGRVRSSYDALREVIADAASDTGLSPRLIDAVIRTESGYRPRAVSRSGAKGLMQLAPATVRKMGVKDPFDPRQNVLAGAKHLRSLFDELGSLRLALAAYHAGPELVRKYGRVPPIAETIKYVDTVLSRYETSRR